MPPQQQQATTAPQDPQLAEVIAVMERYGRFVINAYNEGTTGDAFAESICNMVGSATYDKIAAFGEDLLYRGMMSVPEMAQRFAGFELELKKFINDFISYGQVDESNEAGATGGRVQ